LTGLNESVTETAETKRGRVFPALNEHKTLGFVDEIKHFLSSLSTGQKAIETFEEGYFVNKVIGAAYRSAKSGSWEPIQED
jgi:predicted dehydrogenase